MTFRAPLFVGAKPGGDGSDGIAPQDARLALAALAPGTGVLTGLVVGAVSGSATMKYTIGAGAAALARGNMNVDGVYITANDSTITVSSGAVAPGSGSRYDLVYVQPRNAYDGGFGDTSSLPLAGVQVGSAGSSPTKPYGSVPDGALVLAECLVHAGDSDSSQATINQVAPWAPGIMQRRVFDWNQATAPGFYWGPGAGVGTTLHAPDNANGFSGLAVTNFDASTVVQTLFRMDGSGEQWSRTFQGGSWLGWRRTVGADTGWVSLTSVDNYNNNGSVRRIGSQVFLRGSVTRAAGPIQAIATVARLPDSSFAPVGQVMQSLSVFFTSTINAQMNLEVDAGDRALQVWGNGNGYATAWLGGITWLVD